MLRQNLSLCQHLFYLEFGTI